MRVSLLHIIKELERQIYSSKNLIYKVKNLGIPLIQLEIIAELAFLRIFIAWENFLEESFIRYLVGAESPSNYRPERITSSPNIEHAIKLISGEREYAKWNSASDVINRAERYFKDGEPYKNALEAATKDLNDMNTIRNRIAHKSIFSKNKFNDFIRRIFGHGIRGMTPGRLLLKLKESLPESTFLDYYIGIIKAASRIIVK